MTYDNRTTTAPDEFVIDCLRFGAFHPDGDVMAEVVERLLTCRSAFTPAEIVADLRSDPQTRPHVEAIDAAFRADAVDLVHDVEDYLRADF
jgi:hypothetical protein